MVYRDTRKRNCPKDCTPGKYQEWRGGISSNGRLKRKEAVSICSLTVLFHLLSKVIIKSKTGTMSSIFMVKLRAATPKDTVEIQEVENND
eukprot:5877754-Ditylum_brightwellii.AAC.1